MRGGRARSLGALIALASILSLTAIALADARSDYLIRLLRTSGAFRVRAQAALSLGSVSPDPDVIGALAEAVQRDDNAAVRAAAASSLERLATPSPAALAALRAAQRDRERAVQDAAGQALRSLERLASTSGGGSSGSSGGSTGTSGGSSGSSGPAQFYVGVGTPGTKVAAIDRSVLEASRSFIEGRVRAIPGVEVAPDGESRSAAERVIRSRRLTGYYLDSSIVSLETRADGSVRAQVSVIVQTYPGRDVRSMLSGAATVMGGSGAGAQRDAIQGALQSALRNLPTAMAASAGR